MLIEELLKPENFFAELESIDEERLWEHLQAWHKRGETAEEILSFYDYIRLQEAALESGLAVLDCCGTGGDGADTFNISTAAAILAAKMGVYVAKNGGRSSSGQTGSVDVLEALGYQLDLSDSAKIQQLHVEKLSFFASKLSMKLLARVKQLSRQHKKTTFLSLLAPLLSPLKLSFQVLGLGKERWFPVMQQIQEKLVARAERQRVMILHSTDGKQALDELSSATETQLLFIDARVKPLALSFRPEDLALKRSSLAELAGGDASTNAQLIEQILAGKRAGAAAETVALNAALMHLVANHSPSSQSEFVELLAKSYGKAAALLDLPVA